MSQNLSSPHITVLKLTCKSLTYTYTNHFPIVNHNSTTYCPAGKKQQQQKQLSSFQTSAQFTGPIRKCIGMIRGETYPQIPHLSRISAYASMVCRLILGSMLRTNRVAQNKYIGFHSSPSAPGEVEIKATDHSSSH